MNKAKYYGFKFGQFCTNIGVLTSIFMIPLIANDYDTTRGPINIAPVIIMIVAMLTARYGVYRTGGIYYDK